MVAGMGDAVVSSNPLASSSVADVRDNITLSFGDDLDGVIVLRSTILAADTALVNVLIGTPESQAIAADTLMISNIKASGDIAMYINKGGASQMVFWADGSTGDTAILAASGQSVDMYIAGTKEYEFTADGLCLLGTNELRFYDNGNYVGFEAPALSADQIWVLPATDGGNNEVLTTNGTGTLSWTRGGASTALDNLASVAINTTLVSDGANTDDLGTDTKPWRTAYLATSLIFDQTTRNVTVQATEPATSARTYTIPDFGANDSFVALAATQELTNKTLASSVGKGTWTASGTWTLPAITLGGAVSGGDQAFTGVGDMTFTAGSILKSGGTNTDTLLIAANDTTFITLTTGATDTMSLGAFTLGGAVSGNAQTISNANVTVGASRTLDVSSGTLTLANDQISGDKVDGGTIGSTTITTLSATTINAHALGGALTVGETSIILDHAIGTDQNHSGITISGTLGATVAKGEIIYLEDTDDEWHQAKADAEATGYGMLGICLTAGNDGGATTILLHGFYRDDTAHNFTAAGQPLYLSDTTAGDFITTKPDTTNDIVRIIGYAHDDADTIYFCPDGAYVTVA